MKTAQPAASAVGTIAQPAKADSSIAAGRIELFPYLVIIGQLGLLLLVFRQFQIETEAFRAIALLGFGGFAIHAYLPMRYRMSFFALLSVAGIAMTLGAISAAWLFLAGGVLIGICHLPLSGKLRAALLLVTGAALAWARASWTDAPWSSALWPILGSMFMFRLIIYFYDLRHDKEPASPARTFSYFFMLPNVVFPLYPVIDYKTFRRNYYDADAFHIYQTGVDWMLRGAIHLILYRVIYYYGTLAPSEVLNPSDLMQFLTANFLLYLRISGLFHLIIGLLYLFGFRLPETHNRYLLASSFTDFWRRINIYWKDFMLKIFYYPIVFRLKHLGPTKAMVIATMLVFVATWFLHAYQWFWLRGTFLLVLQDVLFWTILGALVVVNALWEVRHGRKRALKRTGTDWTHVAKTVAKTFVTFWAICVLWSFWTTESLEQWTSLWPALAGDWTWTAALFPLGALVLIILGSLESPQPRNVARKQSTGGFTQPVRASFATVLTAMALILVSIQTVHVFMGPEIANIVHSLRTGRLSRLDVAKLERGYYENLLSVDRFNSQLWEVYVKKPPRLLGGDHANLKRFTDDFARNDLMPSRVRTTQYGQITVNRWGMRDQDYELAPPPGTHRFAILGPSTVMGSGVSDGETFEALLEDELNGRLAGSDLERVEILNFGVPGYQPPQQLVALEKALGFEPDGVIYVAAGRELYRAGEYLAQAVRDGIAIPYPELADIVARAGLTPDLNETTMLQRISSYEDEILSFIYGYIVEQSRARGAEPVFVFLPQVRAGVWEAELAGTLELARAAGFLVFNLADVYAGHDISTIWVEEWDDHPNPLGHRLIADRLAREFETHRARIFRGALD